MRTRIATGTMLMSLSIGMLTLAFDIQPILVVNATPWNGVVDDPTPAQAIWVDPTNITHLEIRDTFVVDVLVNVTDPDGGGPATGLYGFEYKLFWNSTLIETVEIETHADNSPPGDLPPGWTSSFVAKDDTSVSGRHWYGVSALSGVAFTGVASLCTYKFKVTAPSNSTIDINDDLLVNEFAASIPHTTVDGIYYVGALTVDINCDGLVNIVDIVIAVLAFGSQSGDPNWNPIVDLKQDGIIDIVDLVIIGINFGKTG